MKWLADTNILLRSVQSAHPMYADTARAVNILIAREDELYMVAQNILEFWAVATRPIASNGLALTIARTAQEITKIKSLCILPDTADILPEWEQLVVKHQVLGRQVYDARLVAAMTVHGLTHLMTFNTADFKRFTSVTAVDPQSILDEARNR